MFSLIFGLVVLALIGIMLMFRIGSGVSVTKDSAMFIEVSDSQLASFGFGVGDGSFDLDSVSNQASDAGIMRTCGISTKPETFSCFVFKGVLGYTFQGKSLFRSDRGGVYLWDWNGECYCGFSDGAKFYFAKSDNIMSSIENLAEAERRVIRLIQEASL